MFSITTRVRLAVSSVLVLKLSRLEYISTDHDPYASSSGGFKLLSSLTRTKPDRPRLNSLAAFRGYTLSLDHAGRYNHLFAKATKHLDIEHGGVGKFSYR